MIVINIKTLKKWSKLSPIINDCTCSCAPSRYCPRMPTVWLIKPYCGVGGLQTPSNNPLLEYRWHVRVQMTKIDPQLAMIMSCECTKPHYCPRMPTVWLIKPYCGVRGAQTPSNNPLPEYRWHVRVQMTKIDPQLAMIMSCECTKPHYCPHMACMQHFNPPGSVNRSLDPLKWLLAIINPKFLEP
jgi:hypothetical protein